MKDIKDAIKFTFTMFVLPVGLFIYVLFFGYPPEYWAAILIGLVLLVNL